MLKKRHKILAVDDEPANLRLLERLFRRDTDVFTASSGEAALEIFNQHDISLIITDQRMPGLTGTKLLQQVMLERPNAVRIILTGYMDVEALVEAINTSRVYKFLTKPWDPEQLRAVVLKALEDYEMAIEQERLLEDLKTIVMAHADLFGAIQKPTL